MIWDIKKWSDPHLIYDNGYLRERNKGKYFCVKTKINIFCVNYFHVNNKYDLLISLFSSSDPYKLHNKYVNLKNFLIFYLLKMWLLQRSVPRNSK